MRAPGCGEPRKVPTKALTRPPRRFKLLRMQTRQWCALLPVGARVGLGAAILRHTLARASPDEPFAACRPEGRSSPSPSRRGRHEVECRAAHHALRSAIGARTGSQATLVIHEPSPRP